MVGLKGGTNRRLITKAEVKQHRSEDDAWTILKGRVYNITPYLKFHPGGGSFFLLQVVLQHTFLIAVEQSGLAVYGWFLKLSGLDMLMKGAGKDCTALFSILLVNFKAKR